MVEGCVGGPAEWLHRSLIHSRGSGLLHVTFNPSIPGRHKHAHTHTPDDNDSMS